MTKCIDCDFYNDCSKSSISFDCPEYHCSSAYNPITNRDWLNSLSNDEFAEWLCDAKLDARLTNMCGTPIFTGVGTIKLSYNDSLLGLKKWLEEEHNE